MKRMMRRDTLSGATIALLCGLAACDTSDPRQGGFIGGVGGLISGNYQQRVDDREAAYQAELMRERVASQERRALQGDVAGRETEISSLEQEVRALHAEAAALEAETARLDSLAKGRGEDRSRVRAEIEALQDEISALERSGAEGADLVRRRDDLRLEIERLKREIELLDAG